MDPMHVRCHHEQAKHAVDTVGQSHITVVEQRRPVQQDFEQNDSLRWQPKHQDRYHLDTHRDDDFDWMKPHAGCRIEVEVAVVHHVETPERRHGMKQHVLAIEQTIERQYRDGHGYPWGELPGMQQPPVLCRRNLRRAHRQDREHDSQDPGIDGDHQQVGGPTATPALGRLPSRGRNFPDHHRNENRQKGAEPDFRFMDR